MKKEWISLGFGMFPGKGNGENPAGKGLGRLEGNSADFLWGFPVRISGGDFLQRFPVRISCEDFCRDFLPGFPAGISCEDFLQRFPAEISYEDVL